MTNRAARARLRLRRAERFTDSRRARVEKNRVSASMKIFLRPGDVLAPLFAGAAVATGRLATNRTDEFARFIARDSARGEKDQQKRQRSEHAAKLTIARSEIVRDSSTPLRMTKTTKSRISSVYGLVSCNDRRRCFSRPLSLHRPSLRIFLSSRARTATETEAREHSS